MKKPNWKRFVKERVYSFYINDTIDLGYSISRTQRTYSSYFEHKHQQFSDKLRGMFCFWKQFVYARGYAKKKSISFTFTRIDKDV